MESPLCTIRNRLKVTNILRTVHNTLANIDLKASRVVIHVASGGNVFHGQIPDGKKDPLYTFVCHDVRHM